MILLNKTIQKTEFNVEIALNSKTCILHHPDGAFFFEDVDLAQVIRAVKNSENFIDLINQIKGIWREEQILPVLKSYALDNVDTDDFLDVLMNGDEWTRRKMNNISQTLNMIGSESSDWFKYRAMMYDTYITSRRVNGGDEFYETG